jgi:hypothetical protein
MTTDDLTNRYACSLYVDYRLGILGGRPLNRDDAHAMTSEVYGSTAATYARKVCD